MRNKSVVVIFRCANHPIVKQCIEYSIEKYVDSRIFLLVQEECLEIYDEYRKYENIHFVVVTNGFFEINNMKMHPEIINISRYQRLVVYIPTRNIGNNFNNIEKICVSLFHVSKVYYYDDIGNVKERRIFISCITRRLRDRIQITLGLFWKRILFQIYRRRK